jgi:hypothetical protein
MLTTYLDPQSPFSMMCLYPSRRERKLEFVDELEGKKPLLTTNDDVSRPNYTKTTAAKPL